jgi:hypothetical protein
LRGALFATKQSPQMVKEIASQKALAMTGVWRVYDNTTD